MKRLNQQEPDTGIVRGAIRKTQEAVEASQADIATLQSGEMGATLYPSTSDGYALGTATKMWSDLFLASGAVINFDNGNLTLTHSSGALTQTGTFSAAGLYVAGLPVGNQPINLGLAASAGSSALTIALKGADGNDPSATNPVYVPFRNVTEATGTPTWLTVAAATSLVISSGSTLGVTSATGFRLWVVGFNDGGTFRLGVINCSTATQIYPLTHWGVGSSTEEGGAGAADSAGVIYTGTAVSAKSYCVLGFLEWSSSGLTAGTWATTNLLRTQLFGPGVPLPGMLVQVVSALTTSSSTTNSATFVATTATATITPVSAANAILVRANSLVDIAASGTSINVKLSRGNTNNTDMIGNQCGAYGEGTRIAAEVACMAFDKPNVIAAQLYCIQILRQTGAGVPGLATSQCIILTELMG